MPGSSPEMITSCAENVCDVTKPIDLLVLKYGPVTREGSFALHLSEVIRSVRLFNPSCGVLFVTFEQFCSMDDAPPCLYTCRCSEMKQLVGNLKTMNRRCLAQTNASEDHTYRQAVVDECDLAVRVVAIDDSEDANHSETNDHLKLRGIAVCYSTHVNAVA
ncbi:hypothetical protein CYMTET_55209 [Cymbomonas tetramitiformis]|uniref:Uncharacterized protein n=1 Tax=Cymbomonas tetramitiformis TaxID=36881 RepID=A0AAE0BES6_9CHLO|nr:hypothetical protein CYMTET_55209 [Cymbomonas tetramitiformis]